MSIAFFNAPCCGWQLPSVFQLLCKLSGIQKDHSWTALRVRVLETWHKGTQNATALCTYFQRVGRGLLDPHFYPYPAMSIAPTGAGLQASLCDRVAGGVTSVSPPRAEAAAWSWVWLFIFLSPKHLFVMQGTHSQGY